MGKRATYSVTVQVKDGGGATAGSTSAAGVTDAVIALTGASGLREHHKSNFTATLATLSDADRGGAATDYTGQVAWGDGTTSICASAS